MNITDQQLIELLPKNLNHQIIVNGLELKLFFKERRISGRKIAKLLGVSFQAVSNWLSGEYVIPPRRQEELLAIKLRIEKFEKEHNKKFGE